jgi:hypothetical protein
MCFDEPSFVHENLAIFLLQADTTDAANGGLQFDGLWAIISQPSMVKAIGDGKQVYRRYRQHPA